MDNKIVIEQSLSSASLEALRAIFKEVYREERAAELQEKWLSPEETCKLFNPVISVKTLTRWAKEGLIPFHRIGGKIYYKYSEVLNAGKTLKRYRPR